MRSRVDPEKSNDLKRRAVQLTSDLLDLAARRFGARPAMPSVRFDLRGKSAGQARLTDQGSFLIRYNAPLMERYPREFLSQTVPHETAHLVAFSLFGPRIAPHGREWRKLMVVFGAVPERCHNYCVEGLQTRQLRRYDYRCACQAHRLTSIRHNRVLSGQVYLCKRCGGPLDPVPNPTLD